MTTAHPIGVARLPLHLLLEEACAADSGLLVRPCGCGKPPRFACGRGPGPIYMLQLRCGCGNKGATLMYTKPADEQRMRQAAVDGWNLA